MIKGERGWNIPSSLAVNTLGLASSDDDVREGSTVLENEHGILLAGLRLPLAHLACGRFVSFSDDACRLTLRVQNRT